MKQRKPWLFVLAVILALPLSGMSNTYMKIENVEGEASAPGHEKWIELESYQWGAFRGGVFVAAGDVDGAACGKSKTAEATTNVKRMVDGARSQSGSKPAQTQLSAFAQASRMSRAQRVQVDIQGQQHMLENVRFRSFQSTPRGADTANETIILEFDRCSTHGASAAIAAPPNGVSKTRAGTTSNTYRGLTIVVDAAGEGTATLSLTKVGPGTLILGGMSVMPGAATDELTIEMNDGRTWRFGRVKYTNIVLKRGSTSPNAADDSPVEEVTFIFGTTSAKSGGWDLATNKKV